MIKILLALIMVFSSTYTFSQESENYIVIINKDSIKMNLNENYKHKQKSGEELNIKIIQPNILTYRDKMISFNHNNAINVSNTKIEEGIEQCMAINANGNGFMIQKYQNINPTGLTQLMLNELTKESVSYGYTMEEKPFKKTLASGENIEGTEAVLRYKDNEEVYTVAIYGAKDEGIIVVTMMLSIDFADKQMIDLFWDSLRIIK